MNETREITVFESLQAYLRAGRDEAARMLERRGVAHWIDSSGYLLILDSRYAPDGAINVTAWSAARLAALLGN